MLFSNYNTLRKAKFQNRIILSELKGKSLQFSVKTELRGGREAAQRWDRDPYYYSAGGCFVYWGALWFVIVCLLDCIFLHKTVQMQL